MFNFLNVVRKQALDKLMLCKVNYKPASFRLRYITTVCTRNFKCFVEKRVHGNI